MARVGFGERGKAAKNDKAFKNLFTPSSETARRARQFAPLAQSVRKSIVSKFIRELEIQGSRAAGELRPGSTAPSSTSPEGLRPRLRPRPLA